LFSIHVLDLYDRNSVVNSARLRITI
ncbi:unnamed protein product, partial [Rotaria sordida]